MKEKKYVYITILSAEGYLKGVLGLNKSLRRVKSKYGLVVLISPDISQKCEDILKNENIKAIRCSDIEIETDYDSEEFNYWKKTFFKFRIFEQTDFDRVTYLDSDMIIQYNIDHLFENEEFTAVSDVEFCYNNPNAFGINSGMMVFTPKDEMTERLVELCVEYKKKCSKPFGDQEVINEYLKVNEIPVHYLSVKYNANYRQLANYSTNHHSVIHFVLQPKPWNERKLVIGLKMIKHLIHKRFESAKIMFCTMWLY